MILAVPVANLATAIPKTDNYSWTMTVTPSYGGVPGTTVNYAGNTPVVVNSYSSSVPLLGAPLGVSLGNGWGIDGIDQLISVTGGEILLHGNGDFEFFARTTPTSSVFISPPNDYGTLSGSPFVYTSPDQSVEKFDSNGYLTNVTDRDGVAITYTYTSNELTKVVAPDGGTTTLNYTGTPAALSSIVEPGSGRTLTISESGGNLNQITDVDSTTRTFTYSGSLLKTDQWAPYAATFTYGSENNLTKVDRGLGSAYTLAAAVTEGLAPTAVPLAQQGTALLTDPLTHSTTYGLDWLGQETSVTAADTAKQAWLLNGAGLAVQSIDPLLNTTTSTYDLFGDLLSENRPDGSFTSYAYDSTYHQVTQVTLSENATTSEVTTNTLNATGDVTKTVDPAGTTMYGWTAGQMTSMVDPRTMTTAYAYSNRRLSTVTDPLTNITSYTYDASGNPATVIDPLHAETSTTQYDARNHLTQAVDAAHNTTINQYNAAGYLIATRDGRSITTDYLYDQRGWLTNVVEAFGQSDARTSTNVYDAAGNVTKAIDYRPETTTMAYDAANRLTLVTDPNGFTTQTQFDANDNLKMVIDARNNPTTYGYDKLNRQTSVTDFYLKSSTSLYDLAGNVTETVDMRGQHTTFAYDTANRLTQTIDPNTITTKNVYDAAGNIIQTIDGRTLATTYAFDNDNRLTKTTDPAGLITQRVYDQDGNLFETIDGRNQPTFYAYDADNRLTKTTDPDNFSSLRYYDADGNVTQTTDARGYNTFFYFDDTDRLTSTLDPLAHTTQQAYDKDSNVTLSIDGRNLPTTYTYDSDNRLIKTVDPKQLTTQKVYDKKGNVTLAINANFKTTTYAYDADNRLTMTTDPVTNVTTNAYDPAGNLTLVVDPDNNSTTYAYDAGGRKILMTDQFTKAISYSYDGDSNITKITDRDTRVTSFAFDNDNRLSTENWYAQGSNTPYEALNFTYDENSQIKTASNSQGTYTLSYDNAERITNVVEPFNASLSFKNDEDGNRTQVVDSFGGTENSTYNHGDLLTVRTFSSGGVNVANINEQYDANNQLTLLRDYAGASPGTLVTTASYSRDGDGLVNSITDTNVNGYTIATYQMNYDADNNLASQIDHNFTNQYAYDNADQLTSDTQSMPGSSTFVYNYSYDHAGNRNMTGYTTTYTNEMTHDGSGYSYTYDNEGNELTKSRTGDNWTYSYDNSNHVTSAVDIRGTTTTTIRYKYDVFENMIEEDVGTTVTCYAYDDWDPAKAGATGGAGHAVWAVMFSTNALKTHYMQGDIPGQVLVQMKYNGSTFTPSYYLTDRQGSIRDVVDGSGAFLDQLAYDPYGNITTESFAINRGNYGYNGMMYDASSRLDITPGRFYDPSTGRWLEQDPAGQGPDVNGYRYVHNMPTVATDLSGLDGISTQNGSVWWDINGRQGPASLWIGNLTGNGNVSPIDFNSGDVSLELLSNLVF